MKYLFWVDEEKGYIKRFMILMNEKNVYQRVHQFDKSFWRVYHSTLIFFSGEAHKYMAALKSEIGIGRRVERIFCI
jgi:hypothetical protein